MITTAFVLGAGKGTRMRELTNTLPKPLIQIHGKPLITYALDHLIAHGIKKFIINTHHHAHAYQTTFPNAHYRDCPITFRHEPILLETGGGIANIADLISKNQSLLVYNGDILSDLPLTPLIEAHEQGTQLVTLALRSEGKEKRIAFDSKSGKIKNIRHLLDNPFPHTHQFTGIYTLRPTFLNYLSHPPRTESVVPAFAQLIREEKIHGVEINTHQWHDIGTPEALEEIEQHLTKGKI